MQSFRPDRPSESPKPGIAVDQATRRYGTHGTANAFLHKKTPGKKVEGFFQDLLVDVMLSLRYV